MTLIVKEDVMEILNSYDIPQVVRTYVKCLPPVQPSCPCDKCAMNGSVSKYCDNCKPNRLKGHWIAIYGKNGKTVIAYRCSECGGSPKHAIKSKFCPNCGADMRGDTE